MKKVITLVHLISTIVFFMIWIQCCRSTSETISENRFLVLDSLQVIHECGLNMKQKYKACFIIDAECPSCIDKLKEYDAISNFFDTVAFTAIAIAGDDFLFFKHLLRKGAIKPEFINICIDRNKQYIAKYNSLSHLMKGHLIITDSNHKIIADNVPINVNSIRETLK